MVPIPQKFPETSIRKSPRIIYVKTGSRGRPRRAVMKRGRRSERINHVRLPSRLSLAKRRNIALLSLLRAIARRSRARKLQQFHSIREVASHFRVSPTAVARIFDQLKREGLLMPIGDRAQPSRAGGAGDDDNGIRSVAHYLFGGGIARTTYSTTVRVRSLPSPPS
jgi:hypothetical protein